MFYFCPEIICEGVNNILPHHQIHLKALYFSFFYFDSLEV